MDAVSAATPRCILALLVDLLCVQHQNATMEKQPHGAPLSMSTICVHAGERRVEGSVVAPIFQSATFVESESVSGAYDSVRYTRCNNNPSQLVCCVCWRPRRRLAPAGGGGGLAAGDMPAIRAHTHTHTPHTSHNPEKTKT